MNHKHLESEAAIIAAIAGGQTALNFFEKNIEVELKADKTPVTEADRKTEETIISKLQNRFPDIGFFGEELGEHGPQNRRWIIDPIDATKNFIKGIPLWATLIALEEEGEITIGVAHNPVTNELWSAVKGEGAFYNKKRISVSSVDLLDEALLLHSNIRIMMESKYWDMFQCLVRKSYRQRGPGDFTGYMMVAQGLGEIYLEPSGLKPHDLAAPSIIVREAGGKFTDIKGNSSIYSGSSLATNSVLHDEVVTALNNFQF